jgi:hypothetical protein
MIKPEIFPSEEIESLYKDLESDKFSDKRRYSKLKEFGLVGIFKYDGKEFFVHPNHPYKTYMFRIPICSAGKAQERTNRSKFVALKNVVIKWFFGRSLTEQISEEFLSKSLRPWFAQHMTGYATISIPLFLAEDFESDFNRTQCDIFCITPNLERASCPECSHLFTIESQENTLECPNCGFTFIK